MRITAMPGIANKMHMKMSATAAGKQPAAATQPAAAQHTSKHTATQQAQLGAGAVHHVAITMSMGKWTDHKIHALASNADFSVKAGEKVNLKLTNTDGDMTHSFTAPKLGIDIKLPPAKDGKPYIKTVIFTAPAAGTLEWYCSVPCDPKAMATDGMMRGIITVTK